MRQEPTDRKYGILGTVIFHLLVLIVLLGAGIAGEVQKGNVEIELSDIPDALLEKILEEKLHKEEVRRQSSDEEVQKMLKSLAINENIKVEKAASADKVKEYIDEVLEELNSKSGARTSTKDKNYLKDSLQHAKDLRERRLDSLKSTVYAGQSSASYNLEGRYIRHLPIPVFKCEYGGKVVVTISVDSEGTVQKADIDVAQSKSDPCLHSAAVGAALRSLFSRAPNVSSLQRGTITFNFVKQ
ncbi:hypothetical protein FACS1894199_05070 [Bacteroidia bacterium]|nr:hypothetical protein FACS1894199_05070 [Bacteroidia bacterium]